ncbi:hypothetical protein KW830_04815 [Comamonas sp. CMM03]|uniref:hypothetical protein n=1 Tax=Comamonas sp. CMM03 TaxID=2854781 RepID=UPI001C48464F|nr:hypothetical protein [Comamonas sp. CMM03]MBV7417770.1 hypothetical protein [Comamonas sp. CMM03]
MMIPKNIAHSLQDALYLTSLDGYCPDLFVGGRSDRRPDNSNDIWESSVELIYRCLKSNLLRIDPGWMKAMDFGDFNFFVKRLAQHDPFDFSDFNENGATYWLDPLLYATERSEILLSRYHIDDLGKDLCSNFIGEIEDIFLGNNVPWGRNFVFNSYR